MVDNVPSRDQRMCVNFLGVRGTMPCADATHVMYGGHTSCVLVEVDDQIIIFDAGSGMCNASHIGLQAPSRLTHLFLSHTHLDHMMGLFSYAPFWKNDCHVNIYAGHLGAYGGIEKYINGFWAPPTFPVPFSKWPASKNLIDVVVPGSVTLGPIKVDSFALNHPDGATGYRLTIAAENGLPSKSLCYITDHEHGNTAIDDGLVEFIRDTDLFIYDATFSDHTFEKFKGWGHSTWQEAIRFSTRANVKRLALFHHDPLHDDTSMHEIDGLIQCAHPHVFVSRQNHKVIL